MTYRKISVLVPTRKRPGYLEKMLASYRDTVRDTESCEFIFRCDNDDIESVAFLSPLGWPVLVGPRRGGYKSLPSFYNDMVKVATGDIYMCGNDDMLFQTKDWPQLVLQEANRYADGIFNIGVNTGLNDEKFPFSIVSKDLVQAVGFINDERLLFSDIFLLDVARYFNRAVRLNSVMIYHDWAGHGADETRRDANRDEFDMVFADTEGNWTERYRRAHEEAVSEAVAKIVASKDIRSGSVLAAFEKYEPPPAGEAPRLWHPVGRPAKWGTRGAPDAIHYDRAATAQLIDAIYDKGLARRIVLLSELHNGLPSILWAQLFDQVYTIVSQGEPGRFESDGRHTLVHGSVGDTKFLYRVVERVRELDVMVLDDTRYAALISPYYLLRRALRRPGMVVFIRGADAVEDEGASRFIESLRSGAVDGISHVIRDISSGGRVCFSYEVVD